MVKSNKTTLSQPAALAKVHVAVLLDELYVFPSIQVYVSQCSCVSTPLVILLIVRSSVTTLSQPFTET